MRYISLFSGIEAATVAWKPLGWEAEAYAGIGPFPKAVLKHHYHEVPDLGDMAQIDWGKYRGTVDLVWERETLHEVVEVEDVVPADFDEGGESVED